MRARSFSEEVTTESEANNGAAPEYAFEGFNIEFSDKVMITPLTPGRNAVAKGQSVARQFKVEPATDNLGEVPFPVGERIRLDIERDEAEKRIFQFATGSNLAAVDWQPNRGIAPKGYIKGMALAFAIMYCNWKNGDPVAREIAKANTGDAATDALAHYAREFAAAGMDNSVDGADTFRHVFVLLYSLGMRESSGNYCVGQDHDQNTNGETAEAGLFQLSYNSRRGSPLMPELFQKYKADPTGLIEVFKEGVHCRAKEAINVGAGDAKEFQRLTKASPLFAVEYAAVGLRNIRQQWGPIERKEAKIRAECEWMFLDVQRVVDSENLCQKLFGGWPPNQQAAP